MAGPHVAMHTVVGMGAGTGLGDGVAGGCGQVSALAAGAGVGANGGPRAGAQQGSGAVDGVAPFSGVGGSQRDGIYLQPLEGLAQQANASEPSCTVEGGPARLLFFPPNGGPPAAQTPVTAWGQNFNPDYCFIWVETLYATLSPSGTTSGSVVGPTFSNAIFPFRSSEISAQCEGTLAGYGGAASAPRATDTPVDFAALQQGILPQGCENIAAPARFAQIVPEWSHGLFWDVHFEKPLAINQGFAKRPPGIGGQPCEGCPAAPASVPAKATASPTIVFQGYKGIGTPLPGAGGSAYATAPPGVHPVSYGQFANTATTSIVGTGSAAVVPVQGNNATATAAISPTHRPAGFTGAARPLTLDVGQGWTSTLVGILLCVAVLL